MLVADLLPFFSKSNILQTSCTSFCIISFYVCHSQFYSNTMEGLVLFSSSFSIFVPELCTCKTSLRLLHSTFFLLFSIHEGINEYQCTLYFFPWDLGSLGSQDTSHFAFVLLVWLSSSSPILNVWVYPLHSKVTLLENFSLANNFKYTVMISDADSFFCGHVDVMYWQFYFLWI